MRIAIYFGISGLVEGRKTGIGPGGVPARSEVKRG